jgi:hypothetical protein
VAVAPTGTASGSSSLPTSRSKLLHPLDGMDRAARPSREYLGDEPAAFVVSLNLHRRHIDESQQAMVAATLANMELGDNQHGGSANLQTHVSQGDAADMLNVSTRTVAAAAKVLKKARESVVHAVESGAVPVSPAAQVAALV